MQKIIILNTSPRPKGNCAVLEARLGARLAAAGAEVETVDFRKASINYCLGCDACMRHDEPWCAQHDDMSALLPRLDACDAFVLLTPIYFGEVTAQAKTFVDRLYAFFNPTKPNMTVATRFGKKAAVITTSGSTPTEHATGKAKAVAEGALPVAGFTQARTLSFNNINVPGSIAQDESALARLDGLADWLLA